jgi:hypothetical protein
MFKEESNMTKSREELYYEAFHGSSATESKEVQALDVALDIRKFEIELYWKRAAYFWAFTGAALVAYLAALTSKGVESRPRALLLTSCVGLVFAVAWYLVNRASKYWQANWELHVDLLEDKVNSPIYKTVLAGSNPWWKLQGPYPFSVSKINQLLSLFVLLMFGLLAANTLIEYYVISCNWEPFPTLCVVLTIAAIASLAILGRTGDGDTIATISLRKTIVAD